MPDSKRPLVAHMTAEGEELAASSITLRASLVQEQQNLTQNKASDLKKLPPKNLQLPVVLCIN